MKPNRKKSDYINEEDIDMRKNKLFWIIYIAISFVALIVAFPTLLFTTYPYGIIAIALYLIIALILSVYSLKRNTPESERIKKVLFIWMLIPIITLITMLILIGIGIIQFPG